MSRQWWDDNTYRIQLEQKVESGAWYISAESVVGRVIKVIYAGYKVELPDNSVTIVKPDQCGDCLKDITIEEYHNLVKAWNDLNTERLNRIADFEKFRLDKLGQQNSCQHQDSKNYLSASAAGCDIYDTVCSICNKVLRRSWSTAYDRDPKDHISDLDWWRREHMRLFQQDPLPTDYIVVDRLENL